MRSRYDGNPGKEASIANVRHKRLEAQHSAKDAFVKKVQSEQGRYAGKAPKLEEKSMHFNAYMCNNGEHAQSFGKKLTMGLDKVAFPVNGQGDDSGCNVPCRTLRWMSYGTGCQDDKRCHY